MVTRCNGENCGHWDARGCWQRGKNELVGMTRTVEVPSISESDNTRLVRLRDCA